MQPGSEPEDIHVILSRFHTWAGKNPGNGDATSVAGEPGVREIPYEEAMRNFRQRRKPQTRRVAPSTEPPVAAAPLAPSDPTPPPDLPSPAPAEGPAVALAAPTCLPAPAPTAELALSSSRKRPARKKPAGELREVDAQPVTAPALPAIQTKAIRTVQPKPSTAKPAARSSALAKMSAASLVRQNALLAKKPVFRKVLAKTVRNTSPAAPNPCKNTAPADRTRRITTRFSAAEQRRLERAAAQAGLTTSAWLRQCALRAERVSVPPPTPAAPARLRASGTSARSGKSGAASTSRTLARSRTVSTSHTSSKSARSATPRTSARPRISGKLSTLSSSGKSTTPRTSGGRPGAAKAAALAQPPASTLFSTPAPSGLGSWLTLLRQRFLSSPARFSERA